MIPNKKQLLKYWKTQLSISNRYYDEIIKLEETMQKVFNEPDLGFVWVDNAIVGIGTLNNPNKMRLVQF